ncbi:MAG: aminotransferase class IV [Flavobacteriales bacterium]|nr:aminotransferase class IV [Flavobacteriales bacterium]
MLQQYDARNANLQIFVGDGLKPRNEAGVSVFDSSVQGGDGVWEGLRVYREGILHLDKHLQRMFDSAHALAFQEIPTEAFIKDAIRATLSANGMEDGVHIRLTLTRGVKITSGMDPRLNQSGPVLIVLAEWKPMVYDNAHGIEVITSTQRRNAPQFLDSKIHHNNLLNNILAKVQANVAGVDAAIMLDENGFIAELNDTNVFLIKDDILLTPRPVACLPGITRGHVMDVARQNGWSVGEADISLTELYTADLAFATGTMGGLTPITKADGRSIGNALGTTRFHALDAWVKSDIPNRCSKP